MKNKNDILAKVLVTGGNGSVASYVDFCQKVTRASFDITSRLGAEEFVREFQPKVILHLAAETDLKKCEENPDYAYLVNAIGTQNLALAAQAVGAKMVYVSTDAVFPQSQFAHSTLDEPKPISIYGHSKYRGEVYVQDAVDDYIIARTSWIFGGGSARDKKFVAKFIAELEKPEAQAVSDEFNSPTYARDFVSVLKDLILKDERGVFHITNSGTASRYDMALVMKESLKKKTKIKPVSVEQFDLALHLRSSGGLISNVVLRSWQEALEDYLRTEWQK